MSLANSILHGLTPNGALADGCLRCVEGILDGASEQELGEHLVLLMQLKEFLSARDYRDAAESVEVLSSRGMDRLVSIRRARQRGGDHRLDGWMAWTGEVRVLAPMWHDSVHPSGLAVHQLWSDRMTRLESPWVFSGDRSIRSPSPHEVGAIGGVPPLRSGASSCLRRRAFVVTGPTSGSKS